jgi:hypothetical protein
VNSLHENVLAFHRKFGAVVGTTPAAPSDAVLGLRLRLISEEYGELMSALYAGDLAQIAKEAADLKYVIEGTLISYGIDSRPIDAAVHASNMAKDGRVRGDLKVMKGDGYRPPDVAGLLERQPPLGSDARGPMTDGERSALEYLEHEIVRSNRREVRAVAFRSIRDRDLYRGTHPTFDEYLMDWITPIAIPAEVGS